MSTSNIQHVLESLQRGLDEIKPIITKTTSPSKKLSQSSVVLKKVLEMTDTVNSLNRRNMDPSQVQTVKRITQTLRDKRQAARSRIRAAMDAYEAEKQILEQEQAQLAEAQANIDELNDDIEMMGSSLTDNAYDAKADKRKAKKKGLDYEILEMDHTSRLAEIRAIDEFLQDEEFRTQTQQVIGRPKSGSSEGPSTAN